jgi:hypothetical protein
MMNNVTEADVKKMVEEVKKELKNFIGVYLDCFATNIIGIDEVYVEAKEIFFEQKVGVLQEKIDVLEKQFKKVEARKKLVEKSMFATNRLLKVTTDARECSDIYDKLILRSQQKDFELEEMRAICRKQHLLEVELAVVRYVKVIV